MVNKLTPTQIKEIEEGRFLSNTLTSSQLKSLRSKSFSERNKIIQDELNRINRINVKKAREKENFIF